MKLTWWLKVKSSKAETWNSYCPDKWYPMIIKDIVSCRFLSFTIQVVHPTCGPLCHVYVGHCSCTWQLLRILYVLCKMYGFGNIGRFIVKMFPLLTKRAPRVIRGYKIFPNLTCVVDSWEYKCFYMCYNIVMSRLCLTVLSSF